MDRRCSIDGCFLIGSPCAVQTDTLYKDRTADQVKPLKYIYNYQKRLAKSSDISETDSNGSMNKTVIVRQNPVAASGKTAVRPGLPSSGTRRVISLSNQISSAPRMRGQDVRLGQCVVRVAGRCVFAHAACLTTWIGDVTPNGQSCATTPLAFDLHPDASRTPCLRHRSATGTPVSCLITMPIT